MIALFIGIVLFGAGGLALLLLWALLGWSRARANLVRARVRVGHSSSRLASTRAELVLITEARDRAAARAAALAQVLSEVRATAALTPDALDGYPAETQFTPEAFADVWAQLDRLDTGHPIEWEWRQP